MRVLSRVFKVFKNNRIEMKHIKGDRFLRQALIEGADFIEVEVQCKH